MHEGTNCNQDDGRDKVYMNNKESKGSMDEKRTKGQVVSKTKIGTTYKKNKKREGSVFEKHTKKQPKTKTNVMTTYGKKTFEALTMVN